MGTTMLTPFIIVASLAAGPQSDGDVAAFLEGVTPSFEALVPALLARSRYRELNKDDPVEEAAIDRRVTPALHEFEVAVAAHWPFDEEEWTEEQQRYREALRELSTLSVQAKVGKVTRDEAIEMMMEFAERYPKSEVKDKAYHRIAHLYSGMDPRMKDQARQMFARLVQSEGPLTASRIKGMANVASVEADAEKRLEDRQELLNKLERLRDPTVLSDRILTPFAVEGPERYVDRVVSAIINIEGFYANTAKNMIGDARRAENAEEAIRRLLESAPDTPEGPAANPYFQQQVERLGIAK